MQRKKFNSLEVARKGETAASREATTAQPKITRRDVCLVLSEEDLDLMPKAAWRILRRLSDNQSPAEIRESLWITESTWQSHIRTINAALGTRCYKDAVAKAREIGFVA